MLITLKRRLIALMGDAYLAMDGDDLEQEVRTNYAWASRYLSRSSDWPMVSSFYREAVANGDLNAMSATDTDILSDLYTSSVPEEQRNQVLDDTYGETAQDELRFLRTDDSGTSSAPQQDAPTAERTQEPMPDVMDRLAGDSEGDGADGDGDGDGDGGPGDMRMNDDGTPLPEYNGDMNWHEVPGDGELWEVDGEYALAYRSGVGGAYVYYTVGDNTDLERIFPEGMPEARVLTQDEADRLGAINPGSHNLLTLDLGDNWEESFNTTMQREALTSPWLKDGEVVATMLSALLEGRDITEADLEGTDYFSSRSDAEIEYIAETATMSRDEYDQFHQDYEQRMRESLLEAGVRDPDGTTVKFMAQKWASGQWSDSYAASQVIALSNPYSAIDMDEELSNLTSDQTFDTLGTRTREVRNTVEQWLGPQHAQGYSSEWYQQWAGAIADDPNAENDLIDHLQGQRMSLYPEYDNPNLKYSDIAPVWENQMRQVWGQSAQNGQQWQVLDQLIRANDSTEAGKILRREGLKRGVEKVERDAMSTMESAFGDQVVRSF